MMRFKIDPEIVRLIAMVTGFVQMLGATLAASRALPDRPVLIIIAVGAGLQAALAAYAQGVHTDPAEAAERATPQYGP